MANINVNPVTLIAGTIGVPILTNAIGRTFITPKEGVASSAEANAEFRRLARNFAIFNTLAAGGFAYATARAPLSERWQNAALGGAIGTGLLATLLWGALLTAPSAAEAAQPPVQLPGGGIAAGRPGWVSNIIGAPR